MEGKSINIVEPYTAHLDRNVSGHPETTQFLPRKNQQASRMGPREATTVHSPDCPKSKSMTLESINRRLENADTLGTP